MRLPGDIIYGDVLIRLTGNHEAIIENYKGILLYTSDEIAIACKKYTVRIYGNDLQIQYFSGCDMKVLGVLNKIVFLSNGDICC